jgi:hypothetical protein
MTIDYARQKIQLLRHKIEGALPAVVMEEEFTTGKKGSSRLKHLCLEVLRGESEENVRAEMREKAEDQLRKIYQEVNLKNLLSVKFTPEEQVNACT